MADFDTLYQMGLGQQDPLLNVAQLSVDMPNWLRAPQPANPLQGTGLLLDQMNRVGDVQYREDRLDLERQRARDLADMQLMQFRAKQQQLEQEQQARQAYAEENPEFAGAIMAGERPSDFQREMQIAGGDPKKHRELFGPGATADVDIQMPGKEFGKELGSQLAKDFVKERLPAARDAAQGLRNINEGRKLLDSGIFAGKFGPAQQAFGQALKDIGVDYGGDAVSNTEAYMSSMGREVGSLIKMFGAGTGLSDADREFAKQIAGGDIKVSEAGLRKILDINEKARRNSLRQYNEDAQGVMRSPYGGQLPYNILVEEPEEYTPGDGGTGAGFEVDQTALEAELRRRGL